MVPLRAEVTDGEDEQGYHLLLELGQGGAAQVMLAELSGAQGVNKLVVLKFLRPALVDYADMQEMFVQEARFSARLNHANIVQTTGIVQMRNGPAIVMEYLEGQSVSAILTRARARIPLELHLRIIVDTLSGLHYAHEVTDLNGESLNVVHRDVSPQNIFVTYDGQVKLIDFGIAKIAGAPVETATGIVKGKVRYMSPEQIEAKKVDRRADLFAVGVMLWEAATREKMWKGKSDVTVMREVLIGEIPKPRDTNPAVPEELERIILKALSFNRDDRYATAMELDADLELFLGKSAPVTKRDIARFVTLEFEDVRAETKRIIDQQLKRRASQARSSRESGVEAPPPLLARALGRTGDTPTSPASMATPLQMLPTSPSPKGLRSLLMVGSIMVVVCLVAWRVGIGFQASTQAGVNTAAPSAESLVPGPTAPGSVSVPAPQQTAPSATAVSTESVAASSATPPTRPSGKPAAVGPRVAPPAPSGSASAAPSKAQCESPYIIDADGIKRIKVECL